MYGFWISSEALTFILHFFRIGLLVEIKLHTHSHTHTHTHTEHGFDNGPLCYMERKVS